MTAEEKPSTVYRKLSEIDPQSVLSHFSHARALYLEKQYSAAFKIFEHCIEIDANYLLAYLFAGQVCEKSGSLEQAKSIYQEGRRRARLLKDKNFEQQFHALFTTLD
jgi:tetratricopeptide (TPR) repeat protein